MGDKMNAVLAEMQAVSLQFDMLLGAVETLDVGNVEVAP